MKRRLSWTLAMIMILGLAVSCGKKSEDQVKQPDSAALKQDSAQKNLPPAFEIDTFLFKKENRYGSTAEVKAVFPCSDTAAAAVNIRKWMIKSIDKKGGESVADFKAQLTRLGKENFYWLQSSFKDFDYDTNYTSGASAYIENVEIGMEYNSPDIVSFNVTGAHFYGGEYDSTYIGASFHKNSGSKIGWEIFDPAQIPSLQKLIFKHVTARSNLGGDLNLAGVKKAYIVITAKGIDFNFGKIGYVCDGIVNYFIPLDKIKTYLSPAGKELLKIK